MKKRRMGINVTLNMVKSIMGMLFPLITYPYIARILGVENIGKVNYAISVANYFLLLAMLGIKVYAIREGAQLRDDKKKLEKFVSEMYTINTISGIVAFVLLVVITNVPVFTPYRNLLLLLSLEIPLTVLGADWINSVFEDYVYITLRTIGFQFIALILIFLFVKDQNDVMQYAFCILLSGYGANVVNFFYTNKYCRKQFTIHLNWKKHIKPIVLLFSTNIASMVYSSADTVMLGLLTTDYNVGIYSTASKIYNVFKQLLFSIIVVCLPRFSYMLANESLEEYERFANKIYTVVVMLSVPLVAGIFMLSGSIVEIIAGSGFYDAVVTLRIKAFAILFAIFAYFYMQLVLLPAKKEKVILKATLISGVFNIISNCFGIKLFMENGAAFTTVCSEMIVFIITKNIASRIVNISIGFKTWIQTLFSTLIMVISIFLIGKCISNVIVDLLVSFIVGVLVYSFMLLLTRNKLIIEAFTAILNRVSKK